MSAKDRDVDVVDGDLLKPLVVLSLPIVLSQLMQVAYNLADTFWVGRLGQDPVSALSLAWPIVFLTISLAGGLSVAGTVLVSQNKGAGNLERVNHVAGQTIGFVILVSLGLSVVGWLLTPTLISLIAGDTGAHVQHLAVEYTRTIIAGIFFMFGFFMFQALLRGYGDTITPMYLMAFGVLLNVLLDPFLVLGFDQNVLLTWLGLDGLQTALYAQTGFTGFGVQGAAIATVFSRGVGAIVGLSLLFSGRLGIDLSPADLVPEPETIRKIVRIGAPASLDQSTRALGITALTAIVALAGADAVAAFGIGNRITSLVFLPAIGLAQGTSTVVGQNLGADQPDRSERAVHYGLGIIVAAMLAVGAVAWYYAPAIIAVFIPGAESVIAIGAEYLHIIAPTFFALGAFRVIMGGFQGSGNTRTAMAFSMLSLWVLRIPPAYVLLDWYDMGATGVWVATAFSNLATVGLAYLWFRRGHWRDSVVDSTPRTPAAAATDD